MRSGLPTGGLPRCREVGFTRRFTMDIWYDILLVLWYGGFPGQVLSRTVVYMKMKICIG